MQLQKAKEKYDAECIKINGHLAQQNLLMGRELDKNNNKLQKLQQSVQVSQAEYRSAVAALQETSDKWRLEWSDACDKFQDLEENRLQNMKTSLWSYANLLSQACVTVDESCEKIRLSLEKCDAQSDIQVFLRANMTGNEIPDAPVLSDFRDSPESSPQRSFGIANFDRKSGSSLVTGAPDSHDKRTNDPRGTTSSPAIDHTRNGVNQFPLDGITQLCRSDSSATFQSMTHSVVGSVATSSSNYSSIPSSQKHTPSTSISSYRVAVPTRKKSLIESSSFGWPGRRSPSPSKLEVQKPLKAQRTGGSMFDALRPSRSRSRAGDRTEKGHTSNSDPTDIKPVEVLHVGCNMLPIGKNNREKVEAEEILDPIAAALARLQVTSQPVLSSTHNDHLDTSKRRFALGHRESPESSRRQSHRRIVSKSEPSSPVSTPDFNYNSQNHNPGSRLVYPESTRLGAPPPAHSAAEMRNIAHDFTSRNQTILTSVSRHEGQFQDDYTRVQESSNGARSDIFARDRNAQYAPGNLRRSPSPSPCNYDGRPNAHTEARGPEVQASYTSPKRFKEDSVYTSKRNIQSQSHLVAASQDACRKSTYTAPDQAIIQASQRRKSVSPNSTYGDSRYDPTRGRDPQQFSLASAYKPLNRTKSKSFVDLRHAETNSTRDGRQILAYMVALYDYQATIPEEIGFCQGDTLAILEMREDGWWIGEALDSRANRRGLIPSNFFRKL